MFATPGAASMTKPIVPPNTLPPPAYLTISGLVPCVIFVQPAPMSKHQVNIEPWRPVCVAHAPFLNAWNAAGGKVIPTIEPPSPRVGVASGPVIRKLVASWMNGVLWMPTAAT
jgi:hypothetical protein